MITVNNEELGEMLSRLQQQNEQREKDLLTMEELKIMAGGVGFRFDVCMTEGDPAAGYPEGYIHGLS